jgi:predicted ribosome quality control (RQC) complex YloA/Tae2 family protein
MQLDALTLAALADDFQRTLLGARVDDVIQPTPQAVAIQTYGGGKNRWLVASANAQLARVHFVERKPRKLVLEPPAFVMLLRKHLEGARVVAIRQPDWERVLEIGFAHGPAVGTSPPAPPVGTSPPAPLPAGRGEYGSAGRAQIWLVAELMGGLSNLILRDAEQKILGALRIVSGEINAYRAIVPNVPYMSPPPQTRMMNGETVPRLPGTAVTAEELRAAAEEGLAAPPATTRRGRKAQAPTVAGLLASVVLGFSRDLGAEVVYRALGEADAPLAVALNWEAVAQRTRELAALAETRAWQPTLIYEGEAARPTGYAIYQPQRLPSARVKPAESVNDMLAAYYEDAEWHNAVETAKRDLRHLLQTLRDRCLRKREALHEELRTVDEARRLRLEADVLLAFQAEIPPHVTSYTLPNPFAEAEGVEGDELTLALDPRYTAVENANRRYAKYHKLQRATGMIPPQVEANELELARVEQLRTDLTLAETPPEIALVRAEIADAGYLRGAAAQMRGKKAEKHGKPGKGKPGKQVKGGHPAKRGLDGGTPLRFSSVDGFVVLAGKNSRQNEAVTFGEASANDLWLHARGVPGAHVIVKAGGRPVPETTLRQAAALAAYLSQAREAGTVPVDYTQQRYVRHMKGGGPGMVVYEGEHTLHVAPANAE